MELSESAPEMWSPVESLFVPWLYSLLWEFHKKTKMCTSEKKKPDCVMVMFDPMGIQHKPTLNTIKHSPWVCHGCARSLWEFHKTKMNTIRQRPWLWHGCPRSLRKPTQKQNKHNQAKSLNALWLYSALWEHTQPTSLIVSWLCSVLWDFQNNPTWTQSTKAWFGSWRSSVLLESHKNPKATQSNKFPNCVMVVLRPVGIPQKP